MKDFFVSTLNDLYGMLLTKKQSDMLKDYYELDFSLGEIAENYGISRQAVHFAIKQAADSLNDYESKLKLYQRIKGLDEQLNLLLESLLCSNSPDAETVKQIQNNLRSDYGTIQQFK